MSCLRSALRVLATRGKALLLLFMCIVAPLLLFAALAEDVLEAERLAFDEPIQLFVHAWATPVLDAFMLAASRIGSVWITAPVGVAVALMLGLRGRWSAALFWVSAIAGAAILNAVAKPAFGRERPAVWASLSPETTLSFPSGHAMHSAALAIALTVLLWHTPWRYPALILGSLFAFGVGLSRVYLGVHFPSDVLAGWAMSLAWVIGLKLLLFRMTLWA